MNLGLSKAIVAVRDEAKGQTAMTNMSRDRNLAVDVMQVWKLDLNSYESIAAFVERVERILDHLDIVVLNAPIARLFVRIVGRPAAVGARVIISAAVKPGQEALGHYIGDVAL